MKPNLLILVIALVTLFWSNLVFGGDTATIGVSCSIPAVPGVNVPLLAEGMQKETTDKEIKHQDSQEMQEMILLTQLVESEDRICYTVYSR